MYVICTCIYIQGNCEKICQPKQNIILNENVLSGKRKLSTLFNSIQHYVVKFVSDLWQVGSFSRVLRFHPPLKRTATT